MATTSSPFGNAPTVPVPSTMPQRIKIGSVLFSINPQRVEEQQPRQVVYLPGMAGAIRQDFGNGPHTWTIAGHTGSGGVTALQQIQTLMTPAGQQATPQKFLYPWKYGAKIFQVFVDDCSWTEQTSDGGFLFSYQITLRESVAQSNQPPIIRVSGGTAAASPLTVRAT